MTIDCLYKNNTVIISNHCVYCSMQLYPFPILLCTSTHAKTKWNFCEIQGDNNSFILLTFLQRLSGTLRHVFLTDNIMHFALHLKIPIFYLEGLWE